MPEDFLDGLAVTQLKLSNNELRNLPSSIWGHEHLVYVDFSNNFIHEISSNIEKAKTLQTLYLSNNTLVKLPMQIGATNLIWIILDGNNFTSIPIELFNLNKSLFHLSLNNQNIHSVQENFGTILKNLGELDLRNNNISSLPPSFTKLKMLKFS